YSGQGIVTSPSEPLLNSICSWMATGEEVKCLAGLPPVQLGPRIDVLPVNMRTTLCQGSTQIASLQELAALVRMHEGLSPPKLDYSSAARIFQISPYLSTLPSTSIDPATYCKQPLPEQFWNMAHINHYAWNPAYFMLYIRQNPFLNAESDALYGGPYGARWLLLPVVRILQILRASELSNVPAYKHMMEFAYIFPYLQECVDAAIVQMRSSVARLQSTMLSRLQARDTPLIFQLWVDAESTRTLSPYNPHKHAGDITYKELFL
ncbi:hypothetical protein BDV93DRAFT_528101, partial [Ceratobasidium sp. AG-I]